MLNAHPSDGIETESEFPQAINIFCSYRQKCKARMRGNSILPYTTIYMDRIQMMSSMYFGAVRIYMLQKGCDGAFIINIQYPF